MPEQPTSLNSSLKIEQIGTIGTPSRSFYQILKTIMVMLIVIALGLYSVNKIMDYRYKVIFIKSPCNLCADLNKEQASCVNGCFLNELQLNPDGRGNWASNNGTCYDFTGKAIKCYGLE